MARTLFRQKRCHSATVQEQLPGFWLWEASATAPRTGPRPIADRVASHNLCFDSCLVQLSGLVNCFFFGGIFHASRNSHRPRRAAVSCFPEAACDASSSAIRIAPKPCQGEFSPPLVAATSATTASCTRSNCWTFWPPQIPTIHSLAHWERTGVRALVTGAS